MGKVLNNCHYNIWLLCLEASYCNRLADLINIVKVNDINALFGRGIALRAPFVITFALNGNA